MASTREVKRPAGALAVARRYRSRERPLGALIAGLAGLVFLGTYHATSLLPAAVVGAATIVLARAPLLRSRGTVRLRTDEDPDSVVDAFTGPTPPVLALQWGVADAIPERARSTTYRFSYLFGLRSVDMTVDARSEQPSSGTRRVTLDVAAEGQPWATYEATIRREDDYTLVDVEYASNRRFGLRRLSQYVVAARYRDDALAAQGYAVVERDGYVGV